MAADPIVQILIEAAAQGRALRLARERAGALTVEVTPGTAGVAEALEADDPSADSIGIRLRKADLLGREFEQPGLLAEGVTNGD